MQVDKYFIEALPILNELVKETDIGMAKHFGKDVLDKATRKEYTKLYEHYLLFTQSKQPCNWPNCTIKE